jgi:hypothetical protein
MINTKRDRKNLYLNLDKFNLVKKLKPLLSQGGGYHLRMEDGKFVPNNPSMADDAPWIYVKSADDARCDLYHRVFFNVLKHVPTYCRSCWKVVVRPRTLRELFDLYELQREIGVPCKCGIERRITTTSLYGGYFYCRSKEQGLERYAEVRELVDKHLSPETPVILKRYCTEYEIGPDSKGPSDQVPDTTDEEKEFEQYVLDHFPRVGFGTPQPDFVIANVMMEWMHYAYRYHKATGDETYKEFTDGSPLFPPYVTYHEEKGDKENAVNS